MPDFSQMLRWNADLVRGLAETVLSRAKVIRSSLTPYGPAPEAMVKVKPRVKSGGRRIKVERTSKAPRSKSNRRPTIKQ